MHGQGIGTTGLLFSMAAGYWVLERAHAHKSGALRPLGRAIGSLIIAVALIGTVCRIWAAASGSCGGRAPATGCPWTPSAPRLAPSTPADSS